MSVDVAKVACETSVPTGLSPDAPETVSLRLATADDAEALALVGAATFLEAFTWMLPGGDILEHCKKNHSATAYAAYLAKPETKIVMAHAGPWPKQEAPVGYAMLAAPDFPSFAVEAGDIELKRIYLFSKFRQPGVAVLDAAGQPIAGLRAGQALLDAAVAEARTMNKTRLLLGTNLGNERAIRFYEKNGFAVVGSRTFQVGTQECCDAVMAKSL